MLVNLNNTMNFQYVSKYNKNYSQSGLQHTSFNGGKCCGIQQGKIAKDKNIFHSLFEFLYSKNLITDKNIIFILEKFCKIIKISNLSYLIRKGIPLTRFDTPEIIENRIKCLNAKIYDTQSMEYKENIDSILKKEFSKLDRIPNDKKFVIVAGLPACGKTTLIDNEFAGDFYIADLDIIKKYFPAYNSEGKDLNNLHELSRHILYHEIMPKVVKQGKNIVFPTTGTSKYVKEIIAPIKSIGYNVELIYIQCSVEHSVKSIIDRFKKGGRYMDPYYVLQRAYYIKKIPLDLKKSKLVDKVTMINSESLLSKWHK